MQCWSADWWKLFVVWIDLCIHVDKAELKSLSYLPVAVVYDYVNFENLKSVNEDNILNFNF